MAHNATELDQLCSHPPLTNTYAKSRSQTPVNDPTAISDDILSPTDSEINAANVMWNLTPGIDYTIRSRSQTPIYKPITNNINITSDVVRRDSRQESTSGSDLNEQNVTNVIRRREKRKSLVIENVDEPKRKSIVIVDEVNDHHSSESSDMFGSDYNAVQDSPPMVNAFVGEPIVSNSSELSSDDEEAFYRMFSTSTQITTNPLLSDHSDAAAQVAILCEVEPHTFGVRADAVSYENFVDEFRGSTYRYSESIDCDLNVDVGKPNTRLNRMKTYDDKDPEQNELIGLMENWDKSSKPYVSTNANESEIFLSWKEQCQKIGFPQPLPLLEFNAIGWTHVTKYTDSELSPDYHFFNNDKLKTVKRRYPDFRDHCSI